MAVDEAPPDLVRIVRFVNDHSNLDVRLVSVRKYAGEQNDAILVPSLLVYGGERTTPLGGSSTLKPKPEFLEVVAACDAVLAADALGVKGNGTQFRWIRPDHWPGGAYSGDIYYAIVDDRPLNLLCLEIQLATDRVRPIRHTLMSAAAELRDKLGPADVQWNGRAFRERGRVRAAFKWETPVDVVAEALKTLIEQTHERIDLELHTLKLIGAPEIGDDGAPLEVVELQGDTDDQSVNS